MGARALTLFCSAMPVVYVHGHRIEFRQPAICRSLLPQEGEILQPHLVMAV